MWRWSKAGLETREGSFTPHATRLTFSANSFKVSTTFAAAAAKSAELKRARTWWCEACDAGAGNANGVSSSGGGSTTLDSVLHKGQLVRQVRVHISQAVMDVNNNNNNNKAVCMRNQRLDGYHKGKTGRHGIRT